MSFARSLFTVSGLTVVSRITGFIRDTLIAMFLGAGIEADAFFVAQRFPNLFRSLFAEGAFASAFVPLYTAEAEKKGLKAAQHFAGEAFALLVAFLIPLSGFIILFMPYAALLIAPGYSDEPEKFGLTVTFSRIAFPYLLLISVTALQGGVLNARGRFGPPAAAPICLNIVMIGGLILTRLFHLRVGLTLSWAFVASGVVQAGWLAISCWRARLTIPLIRPHLSEASRRLFKLIGPGAVGAGAIQINILVATMLASLLPTGAVSYLFYADRLNQLPLGIVGIATATTLLPLLARHEAKKEGKAVVHYTSRAIEFTLLLGLPATIGLAVAAEPIIQTLFERGHFTHDNTIATAAALRAYALSIPASLIVKIFSARFLARHDVKTPVRSAVWSMIINVVCAVLLIGPLQHIGIALATSVATWANTVIHYYHLRRHGDKIADDKLKRRLPRLVLSALGMGAVTVLLDNLTVGWFAGRHLGQEITGLLMIVGISLVIYAVLLQITGAMRWREALTILTRKAIPHQAEASMND